MYNYKKDIGNYGETLAVNYLLSLGYKLIETNYRCKLGEIDIICSDKEYIVFSEVKTRYSNNFGFPSESVNIKKQYKIYKTAQYYILNKKVFNYNYRFDVIEVILNLDEEKPIINLLTNAFQL
ncbi:MAG: YraN family protein [Bacillota bacterium]|nr:YraN family protein [Bacillota bacterium]